MKNLNNAKLNTFFRNDRCERNQQSVVIIGGGFTGSLTAVHLLQSGRLPLSISLIERRPEAGRGIAYSTDLSAHLLNVPAGKMSAFPDQPDHFLDWLKARNPLQLPLLPDLSAATFAPRMLYGDYIRSVLSQAIADAPDPVKFNRITEEAVAIQPSGAGAMVHLSNGEACYADRVVLATGNFPADLPFSIQSLNQPKRDVKAAWSWDAIAQLQPDAPILLVGTGLTMVDIAIGLHQQGHRGQIFAVSRHGLRPQAHGLARANSRPVDLESLPCTARALLRQIRQEIDLAQDWQTVIDTLRPITQKLWQSLPLVEQQRCLRHFKSYWETYRHRIAPEVAAVLAELLHSGQLQYYAGRVQTCQQTEAGISVTLRQRGVTDNITVNVQHIVNCTGSTCDYRRIQHPLIVSLQAQQLIRPSSLGIGLDTDEDGAIIDAKGQVSEWLYTLGVTRKGMLWETTAVPELRTQAQNLAQTLLKSLPRSNAELQNPLIFRQLFDKESCTYSYLIGSAGSAILVDPVLEQVERDFQLLRELGLTLRACLETHIHADHITGAAKLQSLTGCQIIVPENAQVTGANAYIRDEEILELETLQIRAIATPGHTDSHMAYLIDQTHLLTGDALFIRGCGRTDFQGGDAGRLYDAVTQKLFALPDHIAIYPGHDYQGRTASTIGEEKRWNPRFANCNRAKFIELMSNLNLSYPKKLTQALPANQRCGEIPEQHLETQAVETAASWSGLPVFCGMYI